MEPQRYDYMFMEILQDRKTITGFLDAVFGFLSRNTDFYCESKSKTDKVGLPPGMKEQIVMKVMQKFDPKYRFVTEDSEVPPAIEEVEIAQTNTEHSKKIDSNDVNMDEKPDKIETTKEFFTSNEYHNGACFDTYCWSQTTTEVELHIRLPENIKSSKHLNIQIDSSLIKVTSKINSDNPLIFDGKLTAKCKNNDALWTISDGKLQITLDKVMEAWWDRLIDGEPEIDVSKIDCSRDINELPPDSQAAIEKLRWNQQQKEAQRPTWEDEQNLKRLRAAWDADESPFKGQPFDPSMVKFN